MPHHQLHHLNSSDKMRNSRNSQLAPQFPQSWSIYFLRVRRNVRRATFPFSPSPLSLLLAEKAVSKINIPRKLVLKSWEIWEMAVAREFPTFSLPGPWSRFIRSPFLHIFFLHALSLAANLLFRLIHVNDSARHWKSLVLNS